MKSAKNKNRETPRPLSVYLGAAMALLPDGAAEAERQQHEIALERMVCGIKKYQAHPYERSVAPLEKIWEEGTSHLGFCPAEGMARDAVLLIPSMINGNEILDLLPQRSFVRWLSAQGFDVYLLDWGEPIDDEGLQDLDSGVIERLARLGSFLSERTGNPVNTIGYCMGGTLLIGAAARYPDRFGKLVVLSAPWDFHAGDPRMLAQVTTGTPLALQLLEAKTSLPVDWIQNVFARVNPTLAMNKFSNFLDMVSGSPEEDVFIAVEDWLNGGQDLSAGVARACILDWYGHNKPARGQWVDLENLAGHPALVVAADKDILVPPESAIVAAQQIEGADVMHPPCGHISLMAGRNAQDMVWEPIGKWLKGLA